MKSEVKNEKLRVLLSALLFPGVQHSDTMSRTCCAVAPCSQGALTPWASCSKGELPPALLRAAGCQNTGQSTLRSFEPSPSSLSEVPSSFSRKD